MKTNHNYYQDTVFENRVPFEEIGTAVQSENTRDVWDDVLDDEISQQMAEFSMSTQGELFTITDELRKAAAAQGAAIPDEVIKVVRWKRVNDGQRSMTLHKLTAAECTMPRQRSLSLLLDALAAEAPAADKAQIMRLLKAEWRRRTRIPHQVPNTSGAKTSGGRS